MAILYKVFKRRTTLKLSNRQMVYINAIIEHAPALGIDTNKDTFSRAELRQVSMTMKGKKWIPNWITHDVSRRAGRGVFTITEVQEHMVAVSPGTGHDGDDLADTAPVVPMSQRLATPSTPEYVEDDPGTDTDAQMHTEMATTVNQ
tara:strand:- start:372 stop:809 length:438 start_codon:yes stop_codon:yes gene_type:complete